MHSIVGRRRRSGGGGGAVSNLQVYHDLPRPRRLSLLASACLEHSRLSVSHDWQMYSATAVWRAAWFRRQHSTESGNEGGRSTLVPKFAVTAPPSPRTKYNAADAPPASPCTVLIMCDKPGDYSSCGGLEQDSQQRAHATRYRTRSRAVRQPYLRLPPPCVWAVACRKSRREYGEARTGLLLGCSVLLPVPPPSVMLCSCTPRGLHIS